MRTIAACLALAAVAALATGGCGSRAAGSRIPQPQHNLEPAKRFRDFALYYLGRSYRGLPLTGDGHYDLSPYIRGQSVTFVYGQCQPDPQDEEGSCIPPIEISNYPICKENLGRYKGHARPSAKRMRGAVVASFYDYGHLFHKLEVFTGRTTVVIFTTSNGRALQIARDIHSVQRDAPRPGTPLPASPRGAATGAPAGCRR